MAKAIVLALAIPLLQMSRSEFGSDVRFYILLLSSLYGVLLVTSSDGFLTMFLGLEIMSMPVYVLVLLAYQRHEAAEAALKYLVLGGAASAMFLMGASLVYGATGSLALDAFVQAAQAQRRARGGGRRPGAGGVLPEGRGGSLPRLGARRLRGGQRAGDRLHGHLDQGGRASRRRANPRHGEDQQSAGRPARDPAADLDGLGQPGRDAAAEFPSHDRVLVDCPCRLPVLRVSRRRSDAPAGGDLLPARLWPDECAGVRVACLPATIRGATGSTR